MGYDFLCLEFVGLFLVGTMVYPPPFGRHVLYVYRHGGYQTLLPLHRVVGLISDWCIFGGH